MLSTAIMAISIFIFTYMVIIIVGAIIFGKSTGAYHGLNGLFCSIYGNSPFLYIMVYTLYACIFNVSYSFLGMGIGLNLRKYESLSLYIPTIFYMLFQRVSILMPDSVKNVLKWITSNYTFDIALVDCTMDRRMVEIGFIINIYCIYKRE